MESRLNELEAKLSFAEDEIETLSRTVFEQHRRIDLLQEQIRLLHQQIQGLAPQEGRNPGDEIPPHY